MALGRQAKEGFDLFYVLESSLAETVPVSGRAWEKAGAVGVNSAVHLDIFGGVSERPADIWWYAEA